jgi:WD40 repeat protein
MAARFSPDGRLLVTTGQDARAIVWRLDVGQSMATLSGHRDAVDDARFSRDGRRVITVGADGTARIFDVSLARPLTELLAIARLRQTRGLSPEEITRFIH